MFSYTIEYMLTQKHRFHGHGSLRFVYKNGRAVRSRLFTIKATENSRRSSSRFAVVVSKKVHKSAVGRNRIRRRLYEIVRHELPHITGTYDVTLIVTSSEVIAHPYEDLASQVQHLFSQLGLYENVS